MPDPRSQRSCHHPRKGVMRYRTLASRLTFRGVNFWLPISTPTKAILSQARCSIRNLPPNISTPISALLLAYTSFPWRLQIPKGGHYFSNVNIVVHQVERGLLLYKGAPDFQSKDQPLMFKRILGPWLEKLRKNFDDSWTEYSDVKESNREIRKCKVLHVHTYNATEGLDGWGSGWPITPVSLPTSHFYSDLIDSRGTDKCGPGTWDPSWHESCLPWNQNCFFFLQKISHKTPNHHPNTSPKFR